MKFTDFLNEGYQPEEPPTVASHARRYTKIVPTTFYDADSLQHKIFVEVEVRVQDEKVLSVSPTRVKYDGRLVKYVQFLQAIPENNNQALHDPNEHLDVWSAWLE